MSKTVADEIREMPDDKLAREIAFAEGFNLTDPDAVAWALALHDEQNRRNA